MVGAHRGGRGLVGVALAPVSGHVVPLLKSPATDLTRELVPALGVVLAHVPVQGGLLAAGEATDLTPGGRESAVHILHYFKISANCQRR